MSKRTFWTEKIVKLSDVSTTLTALNLKNNHFKLLPVGDDHAMIVYIEKEISNVE